ncbi:hypothetical protein [Peptoniphilus hominis (ex Hitch et al. 2025)]|uniref:Phage protein n=1 Tax=Peptoniphilus hominis (ex Hitch et al. 2025) TaxID=3133174 RepID=A0ABV1CBH3_9FIRM
MKKKLNQNLTNEQIERLINAGASRWTKYERDRLYIKRLADLIGLSYTKYNTGNISSAELNGETISNSECIRILAALDKAYIDLKTSTIYIDGRDDAAEVIIAGLENYLA